MIIGRNARRTVDLVKIFYYFSGQINFFMTFKGYKMSFHSAITFFIAIFIFGITPGPGVFSILARALVSGAKRCFTLTLGMVASDLIYLLLACFGLATLAENYGDVFVVIRYIGAAYLMYLGYLMFKIRPKPEDLSGEKAKQVDHSILSSLAQGFLISASNPKVILFYIAFLPTFVDLTQLKTEDVMLVVVLAAIALTCGLMLVAFGAARASKLLKTSSAQIKLNRTAGGIMFLAGTYLAIS